MVHGFHRPDDTSAFRDAVEFGHDRFLDEIGQRFNDVRTLEGVLVFRQAELLVDDELDGHRPPHAVFRRRRDGLVVGVGVQGIAVIVNGVQRLQGCPYVVEIDFLSMQGTP